MQNINIKVLIKLYVNLLQNCLRKYLQLVVKSNILKWTYGQSGYDYRNQHAKFEIDRTILKCLNQRKNLTVTDVQTDGPTLIIEKYINRQTEGLASFRNVSHLKIFKYA